MKVFIVERLYEDFRGRNILPCPSIDLLHVHSRTINALYLLRSNETLRHYIKTCNLKGHKIPRVASTINHRYYILVDI